MATEAEFTLKSTDVPLGSLFDHLPNARMELERAVPTDAGIVPYFWISGASPDDIVAGFSLHPEIEHVELVDEVEGEHLVRAAWDAEAGGLLRHIIETDVTLLSAIATSDELRIEIRAEESGAFSEFQAKCRESGLPISVTSLNALTPMRDGTQYDVTDAQKEALRLAYARGYFETPRSVTLAELAEEIGITGQSFGSRLRRGMHRLIEGTLVRQEALE